MHFLFINDNKPQKIIISISVAYCYLIVIFECIISYLRKKYSCFSISHFNAGITSFSRLLLLIAFVCPIRPIVWIILICIIIKLFWGMSISRHFFHELFTSLAKKSPYNHLVYGEDCNIYNFTHTKKDKQRLTLLVWCKAMKQSRTHLGIYLIFPKTQREYTLLGRNIVYI